MFLFAMHLLINHNSSFERSILSVFFLHQKTFHKYFQLLLNNIYKSIQLIKNRSYLTPEAFLDAKHYKYLRGSISPPCGIGPQDLLDRI